MSSHKVVSTIQALGWIILGSHAAFAAEPDAGHVSARAPQIKTFLTLQESRELGVSQVPAAARASYELRHSAEIPSVTITGDHLRRLVGRRRASGTGSVYVVDCNGGQDFVTIQAAIDAAVDGDSIIVMPNDCNPEQRYFENIDFLGKSITLQSADPGDPEVVAATVIDGSMNALPVVRMDSGETESSILSGLTITGGSGLLRAPSGFDWDDRIPHGGGLLVIDGAATIQSCTIVTNYATRGGGILGINANLHIEDSSIVENQVSSSIPPSGLTFIPSGGAIWLEGSALLVQNSTIENNVTLLDLTGGSPNQLGVSPPGVYLHLGSQEIRNTALRNNVTIDLGPPGGLTAYAGAFFVWLADDFLLQNSIVSDNRAEIAAAFATIEPSIAFNIQSCTIVGNISYSTDTWPIFSAQGSAYISNSIVYGNHPADNPTNNGPIAGKQLFYTYSDVETHDGSTAAGPGNMNREPVFDDPGAGDYHLSPLSPCINAGDPSYVAEPGEQDLDGDERILLSAINMGADEALAYEDCNTNGVSDGTDLATGSAVDCNQNHRPDVCDLAYGTTPDCNENLTPDECDVARTMKLESGELAPFGGASVQGLLLFSPPPATSDVLLNVFARGDLYLPSQHVEVFLDEILIGTAFELLGGADECPDSPDIGQLSVPAEMFNEAIADGVVYIGLEQSSAVEIECSDSFIELHVIYDAAQFSEDVNCNAVPDECETIYPSDVNGDGMVDIVDLASVLGAWGACEACVQDIDGNGVVDIGDVTIVLASWGGCEGPVVWYVDDSATGSNDGASWQNAFVGLQSAMDRAYPGEQVHVAQGTYRPDYDETSGLHTGDRTASFQPPIGVAIYGGYAGVTELQPGVRDLVLYETILDGDLNGDDIAVDDPANLPDEPTRADNSYHVVGTSGLPATTILDGFTIRGGNANGPYQEGLGLGGGMSNEDDSRITVRQCVFRENSAIEGGAMQNAFGSTTIVDCTFMENAAQSGGAIMNRFGGGADITETQFFHNVAESSGGAIKVVFESQLLVTNCSLILNTANYGGGGIDICNDCSATISGCTFIENSVADSPISRGGGVYNKSPLSTITHCNFVSNSARRGGGLAGGALNGPLAYCTFSGNSAREGGAMYVGGLTAVNCVIAGNRASETGGGIYHTGPAVMLTNVTIAANIAAEEGGGLYTDYQSSGGPTISNAIIWANAGINGTDMSESMQVYNDGSFSTAINYSCVQGWSGALGGVGNVGDDPQLLDIGVWDDHGTPGDISDDIWTPGNYHLSAGSPAVDAGDNTAVPADSGDEDGDGDTAEPLPFDVDGNARFVDDPQADDSGYGEPPIVDMGAYELQCSGSGQCDDGDPCSANLCSGGLCVFLTTDLDADGVIGASDLGQLLGAWGPCPEPCAAGDPTGSCAEDFNGDCLVGPFDLAQLLGSWGSCE